MLRRMIAAILCLCIFCSMLPAVSAASTMKMSQAGIDFIKEHEGFTKYAVWDYGQYSIGYGTRCNPEDYPDGITEEEAEQLLREFVATFEGYVNRFADRNNLTFTQNEFDALVSFTYNLGPGWTTSGTRLINCLKNRGDTMEFVNAMGIYCHAGGKVLSALVARRIREAQIFLYGDYTGKGQHQFTAVAYNANGGNALSPDVIFYVLNQQYGSYPTPTREGYTFTGWYNSATGGEIFYTYDIANRYRTLYAHWEPILTVPTPDPVPVPDPDPAPDPDPEPDPDPAPAEDFEDVSPNAWYAEYVNKAVSYGLFNGTSETTFKPESSMDRAMIATVLYRMAGEPAVSASIPFTDVKASAYYADAVRWCYEKDIIRGKDADTFDPKGLVKRQELITLVFRFAQFKKLDTTNSFGIGDFADCGSIDAYAQAPVGWAVANGIISGTKTDNGLMLFPKESATRAETAKILVSFVENFKLV